MIKGGFIEQIASGRYAFLPLGFLVWEKILSVIDNEMRRIGSQRILTPTLHPIDIWQKTNRDKAFGDEMIVIEDHHGGRFVLGATAEGLMTDLVGSRNLSYKDLPVVIHQFVQKHRDEKRPRGGLLRVREFMMKDAYSFHSTEEDLICWYKTFYKTYENIAKKFDLKVVPVVADSGAIGGDYNHEFMVYSETGEDEILVCDSCGYAANTEKADGKFKTYTQDIEMKKREDIEGIGIIGVEALAKYLKIPIHATTKTLIFETDDGRTVAAMIRGDYDINEVKLKNYLGASQVRLADKYTVKRVTGSEIGYAGPIGLSKEVVIVADFTCKDRKNFEVGANKTNYHSINVNFNRDFQTPDFADIRQVKSGDNCSICEGVLNKRRTIEWAHIFHQGQFYTKPHGAVYTDENGKKQTLWQGAYGIGIGRTMATIVETHNDERGIIWPKSVSPFHAHLLNLRKDISQAEKLYESCGKNNIDILFDDRDVRAGEKFAEADLIGIPIRLVVSNKTGDRVEWKERDNQKTILLTIDEVINKLKDYYI